MSDDDLRHQVTELSAKLLALTILVEALYVDELARGAHPDMVAEGIIKGVYEIEEKTRAEIGESDYTIQVSEAAVSLLRRAGARAKSRRMSRGQT